MALTETQQTKPSVKINHVPTDVDVQTLFNNGSFNPGEIIVTPDEDVNLACLRTEIVYDMSSSDANKNWGYVGGIGTGKVISGKDFSRYDKLIIHATFENTTSGTGVLDLSHKLSGTGTYRTKLIFGPASSNHTYYFCFVRVSGDKTEFANGEMGYSSTSETAQIVSSSTFISKIEGVLKTPAMIYTGAEINPGSGISLTGNTISMDDSKLADSDKKKWFLLTHPVESYYITEESTSPVDLYGGGWTQIKGRFLLGAGANDANTTTTYGSLSASAINRTTIGEMGGEVNHKLTVSEIPSHSHTVAAYNSGFDGYSDSTKTGNTSNNTSFNTGSTGGGGAHNNMPPYRVVYIWKRIS